LDFAANIRRHGPIDDIRVNGRIAASPGDILTKTCPECLEENALAARTCTCCGHIFVSDRVIRQHPIAGAVPVLSSPVWLHANAARL
jgi:hypothetical protein